MAIFIDTSRIEDIEKYYAMGFIKGVTTNPTIILKEGVRGGIQGIRQHLMKIAKLIFPHPLSVEVNTNNPNDIITQAKTFNGWAENIVVKITIHGPNGELDNLKIIHKLETKYHIPINVTAMMSAQQCYLAAEAGASYVSLFGGRISNMGYNPCNEIQKLRKIFEIQECRSKIIVGSTREVINVIEWLEAGTHIVTVTPDLLKGMIVHPYSKETIKMFTEDSEKLTKKL